MEIVAEIGFSPPMLVEVSPISIAKEIHNHIDMLFMCRLLYGCAIRTVCRHNLLFNLQYVCIRTFSALRYMACPFRVLVHIRTYT